MRNLNRPLLILLMGLLTGLASCATHDPARPVVILQAAKPGTEVQIGQNGHVWVADIRCPNGIGWAEFRLSESARPGNLLLRLHLRGLENACLDHDGLKTQISVSSHGDLAIREWGENDQPPRSQDRIPISIVSPGGRSPRIPLDGWFEIRLPEACAGTCRVRLSWIDFYR